MAASLQLSDEESQDVSLAYLNEQKKECLPLPPEHTPVPPAKSLPALPPGFSQSLSDVVPDTVTNLCCVVLLLSTVRQMTTRAGKTCDMSSLIVGDETRKHFRVTAWGDNSAWVHKTRVGQVVILSKIRIGYICIYTYPYLALTVSVCVCHQH
jgi:hypothetical protein